MHSMQQVTRSSSSSCWRRAPCPAPPGKRQRAPPPAGGVVVVAAAAAAAGAAAAATTAAPAPAPPQTPFAIDVRGLRVRLGPAGADREVLCGVDLRVPRGHLHMLLGPNGCGKSTLLRALGGLLPPVSPPSPAPASASASAAAGVAPPPGLAVDQPTGFVFQNPDHQVVMPTVAADVAFGLGRYNLPEARVRAAVDAALALVNLGGFGQRPTHTLSGGQRQRVAIAGALAERPRVLLLDELTTFLDAEDQRGVLRAVRGVTRGAGGDSGGGGSGGGGGGGSGGASDERGAADAADADANDNDTGGGGGVTAVWVTHRFEELAYADSVSYMESGRVIFTGTAEEARRMLRGLGATV